MAPPRVCPNCMSELGSSPAKCDYCRVYQEGLSAGKNQAGSGPGLRHLAPGLMVVAGVLFLGALAYFSAIPRPQPSPLAETVAPRPGWLAAEPRPSVPASSVPVPAGTDPDRGPTDLSVKGTRLINFAFDGEYKTAGPLNPYRGPLAIGGRDDLWNSVGISGWPCTPENLDNGRTGFKDSAGETVAGLSVRVVGLCQRWEHQVDSNFQRSRTPGIVSAAWNRYLYSDFGDGTVTFTGIPAGTYHLLVYGLDGHYTLTINGQRRRQKNCGRSEECFHLPTWREGAQFVVFRNVTVGDTASLALTSTNYKHVINAVQMLQL